jgi:hypothetical protein
MDHPPLERIMAGLASGDDAMLRSLQLCCGDSIARFLRIANVELRLPPLADDDVDYLVFAACEEIACVANSWRPDGGASPWVYARPRLHNLLREYAGPPTCRFEDGLDWEVVQPAVVGLDDPPAIVVLDRLVRTGDHPVVALLREGLERVASKPEDRELVLRYAEQKAAPDPSPSQTVGAMFEKSPAAVRQRFKRARDRLVALACEDDHFRPLLALPMLAADDHGAGFPKRRPAAAAGEATTERETAA